MNFGGEGFGEGPGYYEVQSSGELTEASREFELVMENLRKVDRERYQQAVERSEELKTRLENYAPKEYVEKVVEVVEKKHEEMYSPEELMLIMLSRLIEEGAEWSDDRKKAVRQFILAMATLVQGRNRSFTGLLQESILSQEYKDFVGKIDEENQKLADRLAKERFDIMPKFYK